jgi:hypothetical protein
MFIDKSQQFTPDKYAADAGNHAVVEANQVFPLASPLYAIRRALRRGPPPPESVASDNTGQRRFTRIVAELKRIRSTPGPEVWVNSERINKLRVSFQVGLGRHLPPGGWHSTSLFRSSTQQPA